MKGKTWIPVNNKEEDTEVTEVTEVKEREEKKMNFFTKHWKKIALGAGIALAGVGGYLLGANNSNDDEEIIDSDFTEVSEDEVPFDSEEKDS